jgi:outer membrane protein assembly factor BamB
MSFQRAAAAIFLIMIPTASVLGAGCMMGRYEPSQSGFTSEKIKLPLALNWEYTASKYDNNPAAPVVADGVCYFACGDRIYAVDVETGNYKWKYPSEAALGGFVKATPVVCGGKLYFGASDGNLYCLNATTGVFEWAYQMRGAIRCAPVIVDGVIYVGADDNSLYAISCESGDLMWKPFTANDDISIGVAVGNGVIVVSCMDGYCYGIAAASGKLKWIYRLPSAPIKTSPIIVENIAIIAVGDTVYGLNLRSGQLKWSHKLESEANATPAAVGRDVFIPCRNRKIYAFTSTGRQLVQKWTQPVDFGAIPMSSPIIANDTLICTGSKGVVAAYSIEDGALRWRYACAASPINTPGSDFTDASCSATVAEGVLLILTDDGVLHCFAPSAPDNVAPEAVQLRPSNGVAISGVPPIKFSAVLYDVGSGVDFSTATLSLDGQTVNSEIVVENSMITFQTEVGGPGKSVRPLSDGVHKVQVTAKDYFGNQLTKEWFFVASSAIPPPKRTTVPVDSGKKTREPKRRSYSPPTTPGGPTAPQPTGPESPPPPPPPSPSPPFSPPGPAY